MARKKAKPAAKPVAAPAAPMSELRSNTAQANREVGEAKKAFIADPLNGETSKQYRDAVAAHIRDAKVYAKAQAKASK